ncbi:MAG: NifU family protein [Candidatus Fibromonas sp.]|jgi:NifU-like protein|nr:NifU family protein [Candidatus Fibromonas sp.]
MLEDIPENLAQIAHFPKRRGAIFQMEADDKGLALVDVKSGTLKIYVLIDPDTEEILDTRFFTYGGPVLTALANILCEELAGKKIGEIRNLSLENLFGKFDVKPDNADFQTVAKLPAMAAEAYPEKKNVALAARAAMGSAKLKAHTAEGKAEADAEWEAFSDAEKLERIEGCLNDNVRAMLAGDGGGLEVLGIKDGKTVSIRYQGACAGCGAASGGTLYYIENQLQQHVYYGLTVEPEISLWNPGEFYEY